MSFGLFSRALAAEIAFVLRLACTRQRLSLLPTDRTVLIFSATATTRWAWGTRYRGGVELQLPAALPGLTHRFYVRVTIQHIAAIGSGDISLRTKMPTLTETAFRRLRLVRPNKPNKTESVAGLDREPCLDGRRAAGRYDTPPILPSSAFAPRDIV